MAEGLAIEAVDVALEYGLAMADAIIFATASRHEAELVTDDADFDGRMGLPREGSEALAERCWIT